MVFKKNIGNFFYTYIFLFHRAGKIRAKILQEYLSALTCKNTLYHFFIVEQVIQNVHYFLFKRGISRESVSCFRSAWNKNVFEKVCTLGAEQLVLCFEMLVKGTAPDIGLIYNVLYRNL